MLIISSHSYRDIIFLITLSLRFNSPLGRFPEDFLRERTPCTGVLYASPFHSLSIYIPYISLYLSLSLSLPLYISPSTFLSLSLFSQSFSFAYLMDVFVLVNLWWYLNFQIVFFYFLSMELYKIYIFSYQKMIWMKRKCEYI